MIPCASIIITTRNRRDELEQALLSAQKQKADGEIEIIVIDDGSTDGTSFLVADKFPDVKLRRFEDSRGLIVQRNHGARLARAPIIFSIDDDAAFSSDTIVADILSQFDAPVIGAVAIPFINVCQDSKAILQKAPEASGTFVAPSYIGTAHALRRELFLQLGGYRESLFHQGEEGDYCLRMLEACHVVRLGRCDPIHHFESPRRDFRRVDLYGRRNNVLFGWHNVPTRVLPGYLAATTFNGLRHGFRVGRPGTMLHGLLRGYSAIAKESSQRTPVSNKAFRLHRELVRRQAIPLAEIERTLSVKRTTPASPHIVVAQLGARMHYAVPRILEQAGYLERLYTDTCARKGWPSLLRFFPRGFLPSPLRRLADRDPKGIVPRHITAFTGFGIKYARAYARAQTTDERNTAYLWGGREFGRRVVAGGFGKANAVYVYNSAGLEILQAARRSGLAGIVEQTIAPRAIEWTILRDEAARFPDWEKPAGKDALMEDYCARESAEWAAASLIVCASEFVRKGLVSSGVAPNKCEVVPYGLAPEPIAREKTQRCAGPLRVLSVGGVCLRKGAPYVLEAARLLGRQAEFRFVGAVQILPQAEEMMRAHVQLPGVIPRSELAAQYDWADVFLLPSLCEGSATVTYEALFHGLPVICTRETGSVVRDGTDGFIVPSRDAAAIAAKLETLAAKPDLLCELSANALRYSADYTLERYGESLLNVFRSRGIIS